MRYVLIDFMPLVHKIMKVPDLTTVVIDKDGYIKQNYPNLIYNKGGKNDEIITLLTTNPAMLCKWIWKMSGKGIYKTAVCIEGGMLGKKPCFRKDYFINKEIQYKGGRKALSSRTMQGSWLTVNMLIKGGISVYGREGYEADDMIYTLVQKIKETDTLTPIDIITNDRDLLPLVDEQVSVYLKTPRLDYSEEGSPYLKGYYQITPRTWEYFVPSCSEYAGLDMVYNSVLLYKLIKGDKSDNIPITLRGYGAKKYNEMIQALQNCGIDFSKIFRYGQHFDRDIAPYLKTVFTLEEIEKMKYVYNGIELQRIPPILDNQGKTLDYMLPNQIDYGKYSKALNQLKITIPLR